MIINILIGLTGLGIVVFFHEAGHFAAAKLFGIKVKTFSLGWGKKIFSYKKGETEYCISMLPLGGYCQLEGEEVLKEAIENNSDHIESVEGSLFSVSPWKRIIVFFAGPFMNLLFSIVVLSIIWFNGFSFYSADNRIILASEYSETQEEFPSDLAGLKTGDRIVEINNKPIYNYQEIREMIALNPEKELLIKIQRSSSSTTSLVIRPDINKSTGGGRIGIYPWIDPVLGNVKPDSSADVAGLEKGDIINAIAGITVYNQMDIYKRLSTGEQKFDIKFTRNNTEKTAVLIVDHGYENTEPSDPGFVFEIEKYTTPYYSIPGALGKGVKESFNTLFASIKGLKMLFRGIDLNKAVSGPIRITYMMGEIATQAYSEGIENALISFFQFLSLISIALFFMNLLPIPALDGGQIVFSACEIICRTNFKPKAVYRYQLVGFVFIFALLFFSLFNDLLYLIKR